MLYGLVQDINLLHAINEELRNFSEFHDRNLDDPIYSEHLRRLTGLDCNYKQISSIEGLQYAYNLQYLYLEHNNITDISPLSNLNNLKILDLDNNKINYMGNYNFTGGCQEEIYLMNNCLYDISKICNRKVDASNQNAIYKTLYTDANNDLVLDVSFIKSACSKSDQPIPVRIISSGGGDYNQNENTITYTNVENQTTIIIKFDGSQDTVVFNGTVSFEVFRSTIVNIPDINLKK